MTADRNLAAVSGGEGGGSSEDTLEALRTLFHRLNNQLGIVLANAELLEARITDPATQARASQLTESALQALETVAELRRTLSVDVRS